MSRLSYSSDEEFLDDQSLVFGEFGNESSEELQAIRLDMIDRILSAENAYRVLEVNICNRYEEDFDDNVRIQYLERSVLIHPAECRNLDTDLAFQKLASAYDNIKDEDSRIKYDELIRVRRSPQQSENALGMFDSLDLLAQTLHELVCTQNLTPTSTLFNYAAKLLIWIDGYINPQKSERRSRTSQEGYWLDQEIEESQRWVRQQLDDGRKQSAKLQGRIEQSKQWLKQSEYMFLKDIESQAQSASDGTCPPHTKINKTTRLRRWARSLMGLDTVIGSIWTLFKEGRRRKQEEKEAQSSANTPEQNGTIRHSVEQRGISQERD